MRSLKFVGKNYCDEINLKKFYLNVYKKPWKKPWEEPHIIEEKEKKAFVFAFGAIVFLNADEAFEKKIVEELKPYMLGIKKKIFDETFEVKVFPNKKSAEEYLGKEIQKRKLVFVTEEEGITYEDVLNDEILKMIALVVAQSVSLEYLESQVEEMIDSLEDLQKRFTSFSMFKTKEIVKYLIEISKTKAAIISDLMLIEKPEITWEIPKLTSVYYDVRDYFEINFRIHVLNRKINYVSEFVEMVFELISEKRSEFLEFIIILLIFLEILLYFVH